MQPDYFKQIRWIYWIIFAFLVLFAAITILLAPMFIGIIEWTTNEIETFKTIIILLALAGIPAAFILHSKRVKRISSALPFHDQIRRYKAGFFIKIITIEALAVLSLIGYLVTFEKTFLYMFALLFVAYLLTIPIASKIAEELEPAEIDEIDKTEE
ncbi:MAG TPA: hypothetical protein VKY45_04515 [Marinilabiliaceae bacterium]|nr:hypothetical protein [Marinilabiliaceae bacterium]